MYDSEVKSANFGLPAASSRIPIESSLPRLIKSASEEFGRLRFLWSGGDLVSGGFRCRRASSSLRSSSFGGNRDGLRPGSARGFRSRDGRGGKLNSAESPEIARMEEPEVVWAADELSVGVLLP